MRFFFLFLIQVPILFSIETPALEKKIEERNKEIVSLKEELFVLYEKVQELYQQEKESFPYQEALKKIRQLKQKIEDKQEEFRKGAQEDLDLQQQYVIWNQGEVLLSHMIMEYGSLDYLYIIPTDMAGVKIQIASSLPFPKACWEEILQLILSSNGIGVKRLNTYTRTLYWLKQVPSQVEGIAMQKKDLEVFPSHSRIFFLLSPEPEDLKSVQAFLERFSDPKETLIQPVRSQLAVVSAKQNIEMLLSLYEATWQRGKEKKQVKVLAAPKMGLSEAEKVLRAFFPDPKGRPFFQAASEEMMILPLPQGLVLVGESSSLNRAEKIIQDVENQIEDPLEMTVFWYTCKHANPEEVSELLEKVYDSLSAVHFEKRGEKKEEKRNSYSSNLVVSPPKVEPAISKNKSAKTKEGNFIIDSNTGSILMVVRRDLLPKIQKILSRLDAPKKMVQIEVLLVEKKNQDRKQIGASMLRLGAQIEKRERAFSFDAKNGATNKGVLEFLFSQPSEGSLGIDLAYHFLMGHENIQINANPSILTANQTPASISIVEEISINNGAVQVDTGKGYAFEKSFTRAQYGTTLLLTPTIHFSEEEGNGFITLQTDITFDTTQVSEDARPPVTRRHIKNEIRVADGETIILGGLRRKSNSLAKEKMPFFGDLPGIGKLFGFQKQTDTNTEMFIFITPHIVKDPFSGLQEIRKKELEKRPGDIPEFLRRLEEAKKREKRALFEESLELLFEGDLF